MLLNVFFSSLSKLVEPPHIVKQISWISQFWPKDLPGDLMPERPSVQKYCLMGVGDSFTDFHIDFGGSSVWYHVLRVRECIRCVLACFNFFLIVNFFSSFCVYLG